MRLGLGLIALSLTACGGGEVETVDAPVLTAATLGQQTVLSSDDYLAREPYSDADLENGERLAYLCRACHSFAMGGAHMIGPNLHGMFGSGIGQKAGFDYSQAVLEADFVWTPRALDAWMAEPARFLPGNRMSIAGISDPQDRRDVIAYLLHTTGESGSKTTTKTN